MSDSRFKYVYAPREGARSRAGMGSHIGRTWEIQYLYDLAADPREEVKIAGRLPIRTRSLHERLARFIARTTPGRAPAPAWSSEDCANLRSLGYLSAAGCR